MQHLISIKDLNIQIINNLIIDAIKYYYNNQFESLLTGKVIINFFLEPSTRTLTSFSIAAHKLNANIINFNSSSSSLQKNESIEDTINSIASMNPDMLIIRINEEENILRNISKYCNKFPVINAGSGTNNHPTQALLDLAIIKMYKKNIKNLNIAICGDTLYSRVASSNIDLLTMFNANITIISPPELMTNKITKNITKSYTLDHNLIAKQDVLMILRTQKERQTSNKTNLIQITSETLLNLKKNAIIMHPGPVNRNIEVTDSVLSDDRIVINNQIKMGVCMRKTLLKYYLTSIKK